MVGPGASWAAGGEEDEAAAEQPHVREQTSEEKRARAFLMDGWLASPSLPPRDQSINQSRIDPSPLSFSPSPQAMGPADHPDLPMLGRHHHQGQGQQQQQYQQEAKEETEEDKRARLLWRAPQSGEGEGEEEAAEQEEGDGEGWSGALAARRLRRRNGGADFRRARAFVLQVKQRFEPTPYYTTVSASGPAGEPPQQQHSSAQGIVAAASTAAGSRWRGREEHEQQQQQQQQAGEEEEAAGPPSSSPSSSSVPQAGGGEEEAGPSSTSSVYRAFLGVLRDFVAEEAVALARADASETPDEAAEAEAAWARLSRRVLERVLGLFEGHPDLVQGFCYFLPECLRVRVFVWGRGWGGGRVCI